MTLSQDTFTVNDLGANSITLTMTDMNGNSDSCVAVVTVEKIITDGLFQPLLSDFSLELYPNPTDQLLNFRWGSDVFGEVSVTIVDHLGKTVRRETFTKGTSPLESQLDVQHLAEGMYLLRVQQGSEMQVGRFVRR